MRKFSLILASLVLLVGLASGWGNAGTVNAFNGDLINDSEFVYDWDNNETACISATIMDNDGYVYATVYAKGKVLDASNCPVLYAVDKKTPVSKLNAFTTERNNWGNEWNNTTYVYRLELTKKDEYYSGSWLYASLPTNTSGLKYWRYDSNNYTPTDLRDVSKEGMPARNPWKDGTAPEPEPEPSDPSNPFTDVKKTDYYRDAIVWALENKITTGTSPTTFSPTANCKRQDVVTFLWRAAGSPEPKGTANFSDVPAKVYYSKPVAWAVENGITTGTSSTTFNPNGICTREQFVTFLWRAAKKPATKGENSFTDVKAGQYYTDAVTWAAENGITTGVSPTKFDTGKNCNRGQVVTFLYRYYN